MGYREELNTILASITISESPRRWPVAVLPDGRRIELADIQIENDEDGAVPICSPQHDDGRPLSDEEADEIDFWLRDLLWQILE